MKVELHQAFSWDCEECGRENFARAVVAELAKEDREWMANEHGIPPEMSQTGDWLMAPGAVKCAYCGCEFETLDPGINP